MNERMYILGLNSCSTDEVSFLGVQIQDGGNSDSRVVPILDRALVNKFPTSPFEKALSASKFRGVLLS